MAPQWQGYLSSRYPRTAYTATIHRPYSPALARAGAARNTAPYDRRSKALSAESHGKTRLCKPRHLHLPAQ
jgi:hypothetical protein